MDNQNQYYEDPQNTGDYQQLRRRSVTVPVSIIIAGLFIGGAIFLSNGGFHNQGAAVSTSDTPKTTAQNIPPLLATDHILGNPSAPIVIIEYSDTECPFCKTFHETMHKVITEYGTSGKVAWIYRHFPLEALHKKAQKEAEATECAFDLGGNDGFWSYIDTIFKNTPSNDGLDPTLLPKFAEDVGLSRTAFESCLSSGKHTEKIKNSFKDALVAGATGTPTSFILYGGQTVPIPGAQSFASVSSLIESILAQEKKMP